MEAFWKKRNLTPIQPPDYLTKYVFWNVNSPLTILDIILSGPFLRSPRDTKVLSSFTRFKNGHEYFRGLLMSTATLAPIKRGGPLYRTPPNPPHVPTASAGLPLLSSRRRERLLLFIFQHHGQRSNCPPRGHLLLRLPVARSCRGLLTGDALVGFPPENPTGERPGERGHGCAWVVEL